MARTRSLTLATPVDEIIGLRGQRDGDEYEMACGIQLAEGAVHCEVCCGELGAPTTDRALSSPTLSMEAGGIRRDSGRTTARVRAMRPVCKSVVLLCGRDWTLERVRAKDEERFRDLRPRHLLRRLAGPGTMFLPTRINPEKPG